MDSSAFFTGLLGAVASMQAISLLRDFLRKKPENTHTVPERFERMVTTYDDILRRELSGEMDDLHRVFDKKLGAVQDDQSDFRDGLQGLTDSLQEQASLLSANAEELDIVRANFDERLATLERRHANTTEELVEEIRLLGDEIAKLKGAPQAGDVLPVPPGINASAFGSSPFGAEVDIEARRTLRPYTKPKLETLTAKPTLAMRELDPARRKLRVLADLAIEHCGDKPSCVRCAFWDQDEGQSVIEQQPAFKQATLHVMPNRMGVPVLTDEAGDALPPEQQPPPLLPAKLNKWELFGVCLQDNVLIHATDGCDRFKLRPELAGEGAAA